MYGSHILKTELFVLYIPHLQKKEAIMSKKSTALQYMV